MKINRKKRQQHLAEQLDTIVPPHKPTTKPASNDDPLLIAARKLATSEHPVLSSEKMAEIEAKVLNTHAQVVASGRWARFATIRRALVTIAVIEAVAVVALFIGLMPQIRKSAPGEWIYPVKRTIESIEMTASTIFQNDVAIHTELAERRAQEAVMLLGRGQINIGIISEAVDHLSRAGEAANHSPEFVAQAIKVSGIIVTVVERAGENELLATDATIESLSDIMNTLHEDKNLPLPRTPTPIAYPFAADTTDPPTPTPPTSG